ncbi:MAG TPA: ATPase domain-containing protein, partial [Acidimicrobiia bacterium]
MSVVLPGYGPAMASSAKSRVVHRCSECGSESLRWLGRCPECDAWGTLVEQAAARPGLTAVAGPGALGMSSPLPIADVDSAASVPWPTAVGELDRVLDGGLVPGSVTLLAGEPGMGKSTLLLQALGRMAAQGARCLLVTAEESCAQV